MQETKEAETLNGKNAAKASPPARAAGDEGRKIGWTRLLRHILPHKVRRLLVEHDALEEMRSEVQWLRDHMERSLLLQGRLAARAIAKVHPLHTLADAEFRVFSQWGEDGIIEWLVTQVAVPNNRFIEFGVENFTEANCRFLMHNRNWKGLIFDGNENYMTGLRKDRLFWMYDLTAQGAFITAENINGLILEAGFGGPLGILSIDIDGNDYWVWKAITVADPAIVICEFNPYLGDQHAVTVPYEPQFNRFKSHYSGLYFGASIVALKHLAEQKGYTFAGTNSNGINAFFVRRDLAGPVLSQLQEVRAFSSRVRGARGENGELSFAGGRALFDLIRNCPFIDVKTGATRRLGDMGEPYSPAWKREMD
jgi:hypothetical protein